MHLKQLKLQQIGRFYDPKTFDFKGGLNLLYGPNEAGKSTVVKAIETTLFGFKPAKDWKYASWQGGEPVIDAVIEHKGIEQQIIRKYGSKIRGSIQNGHVAESISNQPLEGHLVDLDIYKGMFSMSIDELSGIDKKSWKELTASLTDAYNHSAFKSAAETQELLQSKASAIFKENGRGQYAMKTLADDAEALTEALKQLEIERAYAARSAEERKTISQRSEALAQKLQLLDKDIQDYEANHQFIRLQREYLRKKKDYQALLDLSLPDLLTVEKWIRAEERESLLRQEQARIEAEMERLDEREAQAQSFYDDHKSKMPKLRFALAILIFIAAGAYAFWAFDGGLEKTEQALAALIVSVGIIVGASAGFVTRKNRQADLRAYDYKMTEISQSRRYVELQLSHFEKESQETEALLTQAKLYCEVSGLGQSTEVRHWIAKAEQLKKDLDELFLLLPESYTLTEVLPEHADLGLKDLLEKRDQLGKEKIECDALLAHETNLSVREIDFKIAALKEKLSDNMAQTMAQAYERDRLMLVSKIVAEAEKHYRKSQKPDFLIRASRFMAMLTSGHYEEILMTEAGGFVLKSGSDLIPVTDAISRGTKEQMYLSLKLAMTYRLDPLGDYPIIMDEIVINFDEQRRRGFYEVLKELSESRQIVFLTCHQWLLRELSEVVSANIMILGDETVDAKRSQTAY